MEQPESLIGKIKETSIQKTVGSSVKNPKKAVKPALNTEIQSSKEKDTLLVKSVQPTNEKIGTQPEAQSAKENQPSIQQTVPAGKEDVRTKSALHPGEYSIKHKQPSAQSATKENVATKPVANSGIQSTKERLSSVQPTPQPERKDHKTSQPTIHSVIPPIKEKPSVAQPTKDKPPSAEPTVQTARQSAVQPTKDKPPSAEPTVQTARQSVVQPTKDKPLSVEPTVRTVGLPVVQPTLQSAVHTKYVKPVVNIREGATSPSNLDVKHAHQHLVVNTLLSPSSKKKDIDINTSPLSHSTKKKDDGKNNKESQFSLVSHLSGRTLAGSEETSKGLGRDLKSDLLKLDEKHSSNMKQINTKFDEEQARQQSHNISSSSTVPVQPHSTKQASSTKSPQNTISTTKANLITSSNSPLVKTSNVDKPSHNTAQPSSVSILKNVSSELKKMDSDHNVKLKQIQESFRESDARTIRPPNSDPHTSRPTTLGRSRFESSTGGGVASDSLRTQFAMEHHVPRRNETVHDITSLVSTTNNPTTRNSTMTETHHKAPETESTTSGKKKFDRNFNVSPEPFPISKSNTSVHFSEPPVAPFKSSYNDKAISKSSTDKTYSTTPKFSSTSNSYSSSTNPKSYSANSYSIPSYSSSSVTPFQSPSTYSFQSSTSLTPTTTSYLSPGLTSSSNTFSNHLERTKSDSTMLAARTDLKAKIEATKDRHKMEIKKAMDFDRSSMKPLALTPKLPRPDHGKYTGGMASMSREVDRRDKDLRRMDREKVVLDRVLGERSSRGSFTDHIS